MWKLATSNDREDQDRINSLKVSELRDICHYYSLKVSENKDMLISRVPEHAKALEMTVFDNNDENDDDKSLD